MATRFDTKRYGKRWMIETVNSMLKRCLGSYLRAFMLVADARDDTPLVHVQCDGSAAPGVMRDVFYRAGQAPFVHMMSMIFCTHA